MRLVHFIADGFKALEPSRRSGAGVRRPTQTGQSRMRARRERGVALIVVLSAVAILAVFLADMHENTGTSYAVATSSRDRVQAEYMAKGGLNLTRLLIKEEPKLRAMVTPIYQMMIGRPPPQLPIWRLADELLQPFCNYEEATGTLTSLGADFGRVEGLDGLPGTCELVAAAENSKVNVNLPLNFDGDHARRSIAMQLFAIMGGHQSPSPYDALFNQRDRNGQYTSRLDVITALIDWWDLDSNRTVFDPGRNEISSSGNEDQTYAMTQDPYPIKNAPFDSLEELRLVRGIGDDFWATFVEPDPDDPRSRLLTIYGSGAVNPNEAAPEVLLGRLCSYIPEQPLCADPMEASKFIQLVRTARALIPVPFFTRPDDFINFIEGKGGQRDLYPMLLGFLGQDSPLMFMPVQLPPNLRQEVMNTFVTAARIIAVYSTGHVGRAKVRIRTVMNFHDRWTPPPPNAGTMPGLGIYHHYRID